ncbi:Holliday junction branch migration DNA helicase RuvB [Candidatus Microgenomates bacterium]|nr:Holliday junction branch migration DNA helicase RuvB [Candidatus Microgenomates bacterium]
MVIERIVNTKQDDSPDEEAVEVSLRPKDFKNYVGQDSVKRNLKLAIAAAKQRGEAIDHVLLYSAPGLGKTTLAGVIAAEMGADLKVTSGPAVERAGDLASLLTNLQDGDVLFIDEVHRLPRTVEEILYPAMEDFRLDIILGKGPSARSLRLDLPKFTMIGATTRVGTISGALRNRFGMVHRLDFYTPEEIVQILMRSAKILGVKLQASAAKVIAKRARLTPRVANRLLRRVRDLAQVEGNGVVTPELAKRALAMLEIDELGLDGADRQMLMAMIEKHAGGPVGVETIAALCSEERITIEDVYEPYLMQIGLLERTPRGRKVTPRAYHHLGYDKKGSSQKPLL